MQLFAVALQHFALSCHALAIQLISIHHLRYAVPRQAIADQIDSALTSAVANQLSAFPLPFFSMPNKALALRHLAVLCLCCSIPNIAYLCLCESTLLVSFPPHYISMLFAATALQYFAFPQLCFLSPRHAFATQVTSLPRNTAARLRVLHSAVAFLCSTKHCVAVAMQRCTLAAHTSVYCIVLVLEIWPLFTGSTTTRCGSFRTTVQTMLISSASGFEYRTLSPIWTRSLHRSIVVIGQLMYLFDNATSPSIPSCSTDRSGSSRTCPHRRSRDSLEALRGSVTG